MLERVEMWFFFHQKDPSTVMQSFSHLLHLLLSRYEESEVSDICQICREMFIN